MDTLTKFLTIVLLIVSIIAGALAIREKWPSEEPPVAIAPAKPVTETGSIKKRRKEPELQFHTEIWRWLSNNPANDDTRCDVAYDKRPFWCSERP